MHPVINGLFKTATARRRNLTVLSMLQKICIGYGKERLWIMTEFIE